MARELRRLLISPERCAAVLPLSSDERHYLQRVLRLRDGDGFAIVDGIGHLWQAVLQQGQAHLQQPLERPDACELQPSPRLRLAVALPRRDSDVLLRMATELGIDQVEGPRFWATTRQHELPTLAESLGAAGSALPPEVTVAIGPEGGWSPAEEALAAAHGWQPVQLGSTILRCSTAAVAAAALLSSWRFSCGTCR